MGYCHLGGGFSTNCAAQLLNPPSDLAKSQRQRNRAFIIMEFRGRLDPQAYAPEFNIQFRPVEITEWRHCTWSTR